MKTHEKSTKGRKLTAALSGIAQADRGELFDHWRRLIGGLPPKNLSLPFLRRALAYEMQCKSLGGPKASTISDLQRIAKGQSARASVGARLQPGTRLVREWKGRTWTIEVTDGGGESVPRPAPRTVWLSSGRGLRIVRSIAHEWGVTEDRTGNVVWATLGGPSRRRAT